MKNEVETDRNEVSEELQKLLHRTGWNCASR